MSALVSALMQIPHIQSLSLTYPSRLEAQFISVLLSLLANLAAGMQPVPLHLQSCRYKPPTARLQKCDHICNPESLPLPPSPIRVALGIQSVHVIRIWWVWTTGCHSRPKLSEPQNPNKEDDDLDNNGSSGGGRCGHSINLERAPISATTVKR
ncbi:hypothetical protein BJY52DRAFT_1281581 [Lactarius psammicola]|nr:hypothetical protein BJY52DRAFT_1281581 [Lactarius psammicola]